MKENIMDAVTDGAKERMGWVTTKLKEQYKGTKKFRQEPVSKADLVRHYRAMTPETLMTLLGNQTTFYQQRQQELLQQFPGSQVELKTPDELAREDVNEFLFEMDKASKDKRLKGVKYG